MTRIRANGLRRAWAVGPALLALLGAPAVQARLLQKSVRIDGLSVSYLVVLPDHYDPARAYPAVLAFGGGPQTMAITDRLVSSYFRRFAERLGYIVVAPAAPDGELFFEGGERIFPQFLQRILADYRIQDGKFHAAGVSNGGISAFQIASMYPQYFVSITAFPGFLREVNPQRIRAISGMCIEMFVGELDPMGWQGLMRREAADFLANGLHAQFHVVPGEYHRITSLAGAGARRLFHLFASSQHGCMAPVARPRQPR